MCVYRHPVIGKLTLLLPTLSHFFSPNLSHARPNTTPTVAHPHPSPTGAAAAGRATIPERRAASINSNSNRSQQHRRSATAAISGNSYKQREDTSKLTWQQRTPVVTLFLEPELWKHQTPNP
ncbi:hypothetical protein H5410_045057 [Solanum commersonii]|uniref:Uncharacterized protein n=1 Tax=Solanum commersonii TaxID=4109 RepID=A0A9J5XAF3_SOLCO|nr:hypothetical protein H5410_045057 [Solanum commersonii]